MLILTAVFAVIIAMNLLHVYEHREQMIVVASDKLLGDARVIAAEQRRYLEHARWLLLELLQLPEIRDPGSARCAAGLSARMRQEKEFVNMAVVLPDGDIACNGANPGRRGNIADRDYFQQALRTREPVVSNVLVSRTTGKSIVVFARAVRDGPRARAVVFVSLDMGWLHHQIEKLSLPAGSRLAVADHEGTVALLHPDVEERLHNNVAQWSLFKTIVATAGEGTAEAAGLDGVRRIYGFSPLFDTVSGPMYLWLGVPRDTVLEPANRELRQDLIIAAALLALLAAVVYWAGERLFVRRMVALAKATNGLAKGNLNLRTGLEAKSDEIGKLAQSFDSMAQSLQRANSELNRVNHALRVLSELYLRGVILLDT